MRLGVVAVSTLAWRNLWRNYRRTMIMLLAISVGVWAMIFMTAVLRGMVDNMVTQALDTLPGYVQIHAPNYLDDPSVTHSLPAPDPSLLQVLGDPLVAAWTSRVKVPAMISSEYENRGVTLIGVDPEGEQALGFDIHDITQGRFLVGANDRGLVIGRKLLQRLDTRLGKRIVIMSQDPGNSIADRGFRIVGVFRADLESREENIVYAGRSVVQTMLGMGSEVSEIAVRGHDYRHPQVLADKIQAETDARVSSWLELDPYLSTMMRVMDGFVLVWMVVVFLALSFGLVNTLMMAVFERIREIGLMQALGMRPSAIVYQFLLESLLLLLLGLLAGNLLAVTTIYVLRDGIDLSGVAQGLEMMGAASVMYPVLQWPDLVLANVVVIVLGIATSLLPAWRAARYLPVEAIARTS